jgi:hypothetical protein
MLDALRNAIDYPLREWVRWRRSGLRIPNEPKQALFASWPPAERGQAEGTAARLLEVYALQPLHAHSRADNYRENLFYLEMLERALNCAGQTLPAAVQAADVGCAAWNYVVALHALLRYWCAPAGRAVQLRGFEADAWRVYASFHSRHDHALANMRALAGVEYVPRAFTAEPHAYNLITMLFPFLFDQDHLRWGLPRPAFMPAVLLRSVWASLQPGGLLIIANQGAAEHAEQQRLLAQLPARPLAAFEHVSPLFSYKVARFVTVTAKPAG